MPTIDSLRARLTAWHLGVLALTLSMFAALLYTWVAYSLSRHHDEELLTWADRLASLLDGVPLDETTIARRVGSHGETPRLIVVRNGHGDVVYRSPFAQVTEPEIAEYETLLLAAHPQLDAPGGPEFSTIAFERSGPVRFISVPIAHTQEAYLQIGNPLGDINATLGSVAMASVILVPVVLVLTSFGGWIIAGRAMAPLDDVNRTLRAIEATDLTRRVDLDTQQHEVRVLAAAINGLLDRLERAFDDLRDFSADASHQLQTPLTIMKSSIELARRAGTHTELTGALDDLDAEVISMSTLVADLQMLSVADAEVAMSARRALDFSALCVEASEIIAALGESRQIDVQVEIQQGVYVQGDAVKLKQIVLNLGDNAVKYTPEGGRISFHLRQTDALAELSVADTGMGVGPEHLPLIFKRFYRTPGAKGSAHGTGLGLAIVKRLAEVHGGSVEVSSTQGLGTRFTLTLPAARPPAAVAALPRST